MIEKKKYWRNNMSHIKFDYSKVLDKFVAPHEVEYMQSQVTAADELIRKGTGAASCLGKEGYCQRCTAYNIKRLILCYFIL